MNRKTRGPVPRTHHTTDSRDWSLVRGARYNDNDVEGIKQDRVVSDHVQCQMVELIFAGGGDHTPEVQGEVQNIDASGRLNVVVEGGINAGDKSPLVAFNLKLHLGEADRVDEVLDGLCDRFAEDR